MSSCLWAYQASSPAATAGAEGVVSIPVDLLESCKACLPQVPGETLAGLLQYCNGGDLADYLHSEWTPAAEWAVCSP